MFRFHLKKCFILFLILGLTGLDFAGLISTNQEKVAAAPVEDGNLLANPGFEADGSVTSSPSGWQTVTSAGTVSTQPTGASGSYSAQITSTSRTGTFDSPAVGLYQTFTGLEQGTYTFSAWIKSNSARAASASGPDTSAYLEAKNMGAPTMRSYVNGYPNASGWIHVVLRNVISYNGEATIGLYLQNAAAGMSVSIDDASFTLELSDENPVRNWGFENDLTDWSATGSVMVQTVQVDSGLKALHLAPGSKVSQIVPLKSNASYIASVRAKVDSGGRVEIGMTGIENARSAPSATTDYTLLTVGFATGSGEQEGALILENNGSVDAYIDSINLFELDNTVMKGVDISFLPLVEDYNGHFYANGVRQDFFDIMQNRGVNAVMPMIQVEAGNLINNSYSLMKGYFDKINTIELAKRAKAHHMKFIASFFYSDGWMSAGGAAKPLSWHNQSLQQLQTTMYNYQYDFLKSMIDAGVEPDMVKIGNEENSGIVWDEGRIWSSGRPGFAALVNAAYQAMKDASPNLRGMLHLNNGYDTVTTNQWFDTNTAHGITWDAQGYSLYGGRPTGAIYNMMKNNLAKWPDKDVLFVETGLSKTTESYAAPDGSHITNGYYEKSPRGQYNWLIDYMQALRDAPNPTNQQVGFLYWAAEWIEKGDGYDGPNSPWLPGSSTTEWGNSVSNRTLFTYDGHALDGTYAYLWRGKPAAKPLGGQIGHAEDSASYAVTLANVTGISIGEKSAVIPAGKSKQLVATVAPVDKATDSRMVWSSSNPSVASVSQKGIVTGVSAGSTIITVRSVDGDFTDTANIMIQPAVPAGEIDLTGEQLVDDQLSLIVGQRSAWNISLPASATNQVVKLTSSDPSVAGFLGEPVQTAQAGVLYQQTNVTSDITVIAKTDGMSTITIETMDGAASQTIELTVTKVPVAAVELNKTNVNLELGRTEQLTATIAPAAASFKEVTWISSDEDVAVVSNTGLVTAKQLGTATITVTTNDEGKTAQAHVTVSDVRTAAISLDKSSVRLRSGETVSVTASVLPEDAKDRMLSWSIADNGVATVDQEGIVTAVSNGSTTLTVTANDGGATPVTIPVIVADVLNVSEVNLTPETATVEAGKSIQLSAAVVPETADNTNVTWNSSDPSVAVVDASGLVTTLKAGSATITVTTEDGGHTATATISSTGLLSQGKPVTPSRGADAGNAVDGNPDTAWTPGGYYYGSTLTIDLGQTAVLDSTLVSAWAPTNFSIAVSEDGTNYSTVVEHNEIVAAAGGNVFTSNTTDSMPAGTYARYVRLTANEVVKKNGSSQQWTGILEFQAFGRYVAPVESIKFTNAPELLITGDSAALQVELTPINADPRVTWSSSDAGAITINQQGKATAALLDGAQGEVVQSSTITATAKSGQTASRSIGVKVPIIVEAISIFHNDANIPNERLDLKPGQRAELQASIFQGTASYKSVSWFSDNPDVATIHAATGEVTAIAEGEAQITLTVDSYKNLPGGMEFSTSIAVRVTEGSAAPEAPTGLTAIAGDASTIELSWNAVNDADGYNVYRSAAADGEYVKVNANVLSQDLYTDSGLTASTTYYYKVTTVKGEQESPPSVYASTATSGGSTELGGSGSLFGPSETYVGKAFDLTIGLDSLTGNFTILDVVVHYDPEKVAFATVEHEGITTLAEGAWTVLHDSPLQVIGSALKPEQGELYLIMASPGVPIDEAGELLILHGRILEEAYTGPTNVSLTDFKVSFESSSAKIDVTDARMEIDVKLADKSALAIKIAEAQALYDSTTEGNAPGQYPVSARGTFLAAIQAATAVSGKTDATQNDVDAAVTALAAAVSAYQGTVNQGESVDKTALQAAIASADAKLSRSVPGTKIGQYPQSAMDSLSAAIQAAKGVNGGYASQPQVNSAVQALNHAVQTFTAQIITLVPGAGQVTIKDLSLLAQYYGVQLGEEGWNEIEAADIANRGRIDIVTLAAIARLILDEWLMEK
jgi:uncharacterized protein YjdB